MTRAVARSPGAAAAPRVAIGAVFTECNHLGGAPIDRSWFERFELLSGDDLLAGASGAVAGMLKVLRERGLTPVPLLYASTCPGGPITRDTYEELKGRDARPAAGGAAGGRCAAAAARRRRRRARRRPRRRPDRRGADAGGRGYAGGGQPRPARPRYRRDGGGRRCPARLGDLPAPRRRVHRGARRPAAGRLRGGALPPHHGDGQGAGSDRRNQRLHRRRRPVRRPDAPVQRRWRCEAGGAVHQHVPGPPLPGPARHGQRCTGGQRWRPGTSGASRHTAGRGILAPASRVRAGGARARAGGGGRAANRRHGAAGGNRRLLRRRRGRRQRGFPQGPARRRPARSRPGAGGGPGRLHVPATTPAPATPPRWRSATASTRSGASR